MDDTVIRLASTNVVSNNTDKHIFGMIGEKGHRLIFPKEHNIITIRDSTELDEFLAREDKPVIVSGKWDIDHKLVRFKPELLWAGYNTLDILV